MGIGSLLAKPISKAMAKPVAKQASRIVPEISQDVAESMATDATAAATPIATRARGIASPRLPIREKEPAMVEEVPEMETDTGLLRKIEETAPPISADPLFKKQVDRTEDFGVEPELIADSNADAFEALGLSAEKKEAWRKKNKTSQRSKLLPEIEEAAQKLFEGKLTSKEFRKLSEEKQPIVPLDEVPEMPSFEDIAGALTEAQVNKGIVGLNMKIPKGERVSSRLDIPAYNEYNTWVVSLHEGNKKSGAPIGYAKTAVLQNVEFVSDSKVALDIARRKPLGAGGRMGKATIARIFGDYVPHNPEAAKSYAEKIFNDPEWTQVGMNPYRASYFYDKSDNMPVVSADEVVQIGPLVMAKNVKKATPDDAIFKVNPKDEASPTFSKGGVVKNEYKTFAVGGLATPPQNILAEGGMLDDSGEMVNGTEVPAGSLAEEVADDVPAMLSEGEFVLPADVVRFIGLERLMKMRDKAKEGLERMEDVGQMGNAEEVGDPDQPFDQDDDAFESEIDSILAEDGAAMQTEQMFAAGGYVTGSDISKAVRNPSVDVRYYKHADGRVMYVTHINNKPMTAVPDGFNEVSAEEARQVGKKADEAEKAKDGAPAASDGGGGGGGGGDSFNPFAGGEGVDEARVPGRTKGGSAYIQTKYSPKPIDIIKGILGVATMSPMLIANAISSINKTKQITTSPEYGKDVVTAAKEVASGQASWQGSPFGSVEEAKAIADFGFMSDEHFDAVIATQESILGTPGNLGTGTMGNDVTIGGPISSPNVVGTPIGDMSTTGGFLDSYDSVSTPVSDSTQFESSVYDYDSSSDSGSSSVTVGGPISSPDVVGTPIGDSGGGGGDSGPSGFGSNYGDTSMGGTSSFDSAYDFAKGGFVRPRKKSKKK